mmetsp:Transcript_6709/g.10161  ORF Transcript_6709/g.10161 Transcript_6709/m.10161 type:complete len:224 (+) Transcript_6709:435-1106(+)
MRTEGERRKKCRRRVGKRVKSKFVKVLVVCFLVCYTAFHIFFPLRHYMYPGDVTWNEYGHLYSWRMKLRDKNCIFDDIWTTHNNKNVSVMDVLTKEFTARQIKKADSRPDFLSFIAHVLSGKVGDERERQGEERGEVPIYMDVKCQLNYGPVAQFTDPNFNIASHPTYEWPYPWVLPRPPFPDSFSKDFPWNFEWTFSWFTTFPTCHHSENNFIFGKKLEYLK